MPSHSQPWTGQEPGEGRHAHVEPTGQREAREDDGCQEGGAESDAADLASAREAIDKADRRIAEAFASRMRAVERIAAYKGAHGLPIYSSDREAAVLERAARSVDSELRPYYLGVVESMMAQSRRYQHKLLQGVRVAYSGVEGAFAWVAALRAFPDAELCPYPDFKRAYDAVCAGECDCAVLPIENSEAGEVGQVADLLFAGPLFANRMVEVPVVQNLLGLPGADVGSIHAVTSHPQALAQCADYIAEHGWEVRNAPNTAVAAKALLEAGDSAVAAIASAEAAAFYGLEVLDHDINASADNTTRFVVLSRAAAEGPTDQFMLLFTVKNEAGALAKAINVMGDCGFNMSALRSRPMKSLAWRYYFFIEAEGDIASPQGVKMLDELARQCDKLKVVGRFRKQDGTGEPC